MSKPYTRPAVARPATLTAWAVRLRVGSTGYYYGWSSQHPQGYAAPLRTKRAPPLLFATETEAEIAHEAYLSMTPDPYPASVVQVKARPTHRLTNAGFDPVPLAEVFPLFTPPPTSRAG